MAVALLVTVEEFLAAMGQDADLLADVKESLEGALSRATLRLGSFLRTDLYQAQCEDIFYCDSHSMAPHLNKRHRFMLSNGCLRENMVPVVEVSDEQGGPWATISSNFYDYKRGVITSPKEDVEDKYVRISYEAGFGLPAEVHESIRQAILMLSPLMVLSSISTAMEPKQFQAATAKAKSLEEMAGDLLAPYIRNRGGWFQPIDSVRVDTMPTPPPGP